jgi:hypothetical protein
MSNLEAIDIIHSIQVHIPANGTIRGEYLKKITLGDNLPIPKTADLRGDVVLIEYDEDNAKFVIYVTDSNGITHVAEKWNKRYVILEKMAIDSGEEQ